MSPRRVLSGEWCAWIADNVFDGVGDRAIVRDLVDNGVPRGLATEVVREIRRSPAMHAVAAARAQLRRRDLALRLSREHAGTRTIERRKKPPADEFFARYWAGSEPVVFTDAAEGWRLWSPRDMKSLVGRAVVRVTDGRDADPRYDENYEKHFTKTTISAFVDRVLAAGETNDFYLVAHSRALEEPALAPLLRRIVIDETYFDPASLAGARSLWFGPKGTVTPLHHDTTNVLFFQVYGRKQFLLASPNETALADAARGFFVDVDPEAPDLESAPWWPEVTLRRVVLEPGEALFLPAGWWHHVRSLDVSISLSLLAFRRPNDFSWYRPGAATARAATGAPIRGAP